MKRTFSEWARWRIQRISRKLRFAREHAVWLYRDLRNGIRIWWELGIQKKPIADNTRYERQISSQNGEDGILEAVFVKIGTTNKYFVEFGSGDTHECNTLYLSRCKGWKGLWMDATYLDRRGRVKQERITAENIEALFQKHHVPQEFDLLSIDIDGNDYWVWKAITNYHPRVVAIEYNSTIPPTESKTIPYDPNHMWDGSTNFFGASLLALKELGEQKGYTLIGCENSGTNAFFVKQELVRGRFLVREVSSLYRPPSAFNGQGHPRDPVRKMVEV